MRLTQEREKEIREFASIPLSKWADCDAKQMCQDITDLLAEIDAVRRDHVALKEEFIVWMKKSDHENDFLLSEIKKISNYIELDRFC